jgi:hypothetical protein
MALEVTLLKQPYEISFTGDPMPFFFALSPYGTREKDLNITLMIRVYVEDIFASGAYTEVYSQLFNPDNTGSIRFEIQEIIDPYLEYYRPKPRLTNPANAVNQRKRYKISYILIQDNVAVGAAVDSDILYAIKGGLAYEYWHPSEFFTDVILVKKLPLLYAAKGEKVGIEEKRFMFWIYPLDDGNDQTIVFSLYMNDGSQVDWPHPKTISCGKWGICCVPVGFLQVGLDAQVPAGKICVKYMVQVIQGAFTGTNLSTEDGFAITTENDLNIIVEDASGGAGQIVAPFGFFIDHRNFYKTYQLNYRNSLGSMETIRLRGQVDFEADYTRQQAQGIVAPSYFANLNLMSQNTTPGVVEDAKATGDTGFISAATNIKLRDLFLSQEVYELRNLRLLPVNVIVKNTKFYSNKENLVSTQIQWQLAFSNKFFTPDGLLPETRTCPAVQNFKVKQLTKNKLQIMYSLFPPYDRIEVIITDADANTETFIYTGNTGSIIQTFTNPAVTDPVNITIAARCLCDEDAEPADKGAATTIILSVFAHSLPVANDDTFYAYNTDQYVTLQGSVLDNDYDPDGDAIEVIPIVNGWTHFGNLQHSGSMSINAAGIVTYSPPNGFVGTDWIEYQIQKIGGGTPVTATLYIVVSALPRVTRYVYVKMIFRNRSNKALPFGGIDYSAEIWLQYFSDPTGTTPLDVTGKGIVINYQEIRSGTTNDTTNLTLNAASTEQLMYSGWTRHVLLGTKVNYDFKVIAGTGYYAI